MTQSRSSQPGAKQLGSKQPGGLTHRGNLGRRGEEIATAHLIRGGYRILDRNWRCARGEIDIVAQHQCDLVFVEVKTRSSTAYGHPLESITLVKLARLRGLALAWCQAHPEVTGALRIDAVAVLAPNNAPYQIEHVAGVFS